MTLAELTEKLRGKVRDDMGLRKVIKLDFGPDGLIRFDGTAVPNQISNEDGPADCTIKVKFADLLDILSGRKSAQSAFLFGKIRVEGDMGVAMEIGRLLG
ncbi:SCP2 sterol-binding domain-containing protein [Pedomonas sp. V897]|uniref:SCP2 sterol-binding domain-containing protein n=1 Tax=Pedomonas sp. V897 TaxID=3446482 RepID=UPI003EE37146